MRQVKMHEAEVSVVDIRELHPLCIGPGNALAVVQM